jgi:hypothetical protein
VPRTTRGMAVATDLVRPIAFWTYRVKLNCADKFWTWTTYTKTRKFHVKMCPRHATCELWLKGHIGIQCRSQYGPPHPFEDSGVVSLSTGLLHEWTSRTLKSATPSVGGTARYATSSSFGDLRCLQADVPVQTVTRIACRAIAAELLLVTRMDYVLLRPLVLVVSLRNLRHLQRAVRKQRNFSTSLSTTRTQVLSRRKIKRNVSGHFVLFSYAELLSHILYSAHKQNICSNKHRWN